MHLKRKYGLEVSENTIKSVLNWLRVHNVRGKMRLQIDNGTEFCGGSKRKLREWNKIFEVLGVELRAIPPGAKHMMGVVENTHRTDDEWFLMAHAKRCKGAEEFRERAQRWRDTSNKARGSSGKGMKGKTPYERLKEIGVMVSEMCMNTRS